MREYIASTLDTLDLCAFANLLTVVALRMVERAVYQGRDGHGELRVTNGGTSSLAASLLAFQWYICLRRPTNTLQLYRLSYAKCFQFNQSKGLWPNGKVLISYDVFFAPCILVSDLKYHREVLMGV